MLAWVNAILATFAKYRNSASEIGELPCTDTGNTDTISAIRAQFPAAKVQMQQSSYNSNILVYQQGNRVFFLSTGSSVYTSFGPTSGWVASGQCLRLMMAFLLLLLDQDVVPA